VAYTHALEAGHHVFMNLADGRVYCLPDGYEVLDRSLDDIRHVLNPRFGRAALAALEQSRAWSRALDGAEYLPGVIGLNNLKATDYVSVVVQALMRVRPLRDALLLRPSSPPGAPARDSLLLQRFGELTRKIWNPRNFKGQARRCCAAAEPTLNALANALVAAGAALHARTQPRCTVSCCADGSWTAGEPARVPASGGECEQEALPHRRAGRPRGVPGLVPARAAPVRLRAARLPRADAALMQRAPRTHPGAATWAAPSSRAAA
jgi:hypothetical protein